MAVVCVRAPHFFFQLYMQPVSYQSQVRYQFFPDLPILVWNPNSGDGCQA
jgi:hypothetical protein